MIDFHLTGTSSSERAIKMAVPILFLTSMLGESKLYLQYGINGIFARWRFKFDNLWCMIIHKRSNRVGYCFVFDLSFRAIIFLLHSLALCKESKAFNLQNINIHWHDHLVSLLHPRISAVPIAHHVGPCIQMFSRAHTLNRDVAEKVCRVNRVIERAHEPRNDFQKLTE